MRRTQELDESWDNSTADNLIDRGVAFLGEELTESSGGGKLLLDVVGHDSLNHARKLLVKLDIIQ